MASATLTCGRKKSLFRSLGSRRRQKHLAESFPAKKTEVLATVSPVASEATKRPSRKRNIRHASVEEMASRLLDDSTSILEELDLSTTMLDQKAHQSISSTSPSDYPPGPSAHSKASPRKQPTLLEKPVSSPESRSRKARIEKYSPNISVKSVKQATISRAGDSLHKLKQGGLQRPLPIFNTGDIDPLKAHPPNFLKISTSAPLGHIDGNVCKIDAQSQMVEPAGPEEINQKLHAMLAATNSLKPAIPNARSPSPSKLTRIVSSSKMLIRVTHAWNRLHPKASLESLRSRGSKDNQTRIEPFNEFAKPEISLLHSPAPMSPISTIEIRLNEGDNLNKKKVQRIVGGQVVRKPVADDGKSLRSGKSLDDPFSESGRARTPTSFEARLKRGVDGEGDSIPPLPCNPFESEKGFDNNIEDRILSTTPVGSSTPRIRVGSVLTPSHDHNPSTYLMSTNLAVDSMLDRVTLKLEPEGLAEARLLPLNGVKANDRKLVTRTRDVGEVTQGTGAMLRGIKKHPSPSKEVLEDLEQAFRKYTCLRAAGVKADDIDELATSFITLATPLHSRDKNRRASTRLSASSIDDLASPSTHRGHRLWPSSPSVQITRIPRLGESSCKLRRGIRLTAPFRPASSSADDIDELH